VEIMTAVNNLITSKVTDVVDDNRLGLLIPQAW
jgi:hypothetical protein